MQRLFFAFFVPLLFACVLYGQENQPRASAGLELNGLHLDALGEGPVGVGAQFSYFLHRYVALDGSVVHYPQNPSGNFGETTGLFGVRVGIRTDRYGVFAKLRPGFIHFGGSFFDLRLDQRDYFALDAGVVLEYYPREHVYLRLDVGDTVIPFNGATYRVSIPPTILGTTNNLQGAFGIGVRF